MGDAERKTVGNTCLHLSSRSSLSWCPCGSVSNSSPEDNPIILCISEVTPNILATCARVRYLSGCAYACLNWTQCVCMWTAALCARVSVCMYLAVHHGDVFSCGPCVHLSQQLFDSLQHRHLQRLILSRHEARLIPAQEQLYRIRKQGQDTSTGKDCRSTVKIKSSSDSVLWEHIQTLGFFAVDIFKFHHTYVVQLIALSANLL